MKAIILAAGRGTRMRDLTNHLPKCLLEVKGKSLLDWQLEALSSSGINEIAIVTGYQAQLLSGRGLTEFHNPRWENTQMVYSLSCAQEWLDNHDCIVSYSDIFFDPTPVVSLMESPSDIAITYDPNWLCLWERRFGNPLIDAETFRLAADNRLAEIGNKPASIKEIEGQYMGLLKFRPHGWSAIREIRDSMPTDFFEKLDMTSALQNVITAGSIAIKAIPCFSEWGEVDSPEDLDVYQ